MSDVECPYCGEGQEINHDNGYGYKEDETYEQECGECGKTFIYRTAPHYAHMTCKADCLNGSDHQFKPTHTYPKQCTKMRCKDCDEVREPTPDEWREILT